MKRIRAKRRGGLGHTEEQLARCAVGLAESGSRTEDRYWEKLLTDMIDHVLEEEDEALLDAALDHLYNTHSLAYEELADLVESRAETGLRRSTTHDVLVIAAPVLAWSRFRIPAAPISPAILANLRVHLQVHVIAEDAKLSVANHLFSPDQLPQGFCASAQFAHALGEAAMQGEDLKIDARVLEEPTQFLSDTRYLLAAVAVKKGAPVFRWQESEGSREQAQAQWRAQGGAALAPLLPGCATEVVLPETYFAASRAADKASRPYAIRASVAFLSATLEIPAANLRAVIAPFYERQLEEYRIGMTLRNEEKVVHGVVWPLLGAEDENIDIGSQIEAVLRECGVTDITHLDHRFPMEYCDDCGTPLYPSPEGEVVHVEMPEEEGQTLPKHLH